MRDGFIWVYYDNRLKGRDYSFIRIPKEQLPTEDDPEYVQKLAEAVFKFLDELYKK